MLEIEMKFPVPDFAPIEAIVRTWQSRPEAPIEEADHYFNSPDRDFARTDEAFRLRRIGASNRLTYKGPKSPGLAKTRTEIEVSLLDGQAAADDMQRMLVCLGYRPVAIVKKQRRVFHFRREPFDLQACFDEVEDVGTFVEIEIVTPPENRAAAEQMLLQVARELKLEHPERRSYLEMLLRKRSDA